MNHVHVYILPYGDTYILILTFSVYVNEPGVIAYVNFLLTCVQYVYFIG